MVIQPARIALIPAYEPEPQLLELLRGIRTRGLTAVVIDDGSGPRFADIFRQAAASAVVLTHFHNCGKGRALKTGLEYIRNQFQQPYVVVTMDADGQHTAEDALRVCDAAAHDPHALILGSRRLREGVPARSRLGNAVTRGIYYLSTGLRVQDTQTGLRAFSDLLLPRLLGISGERYEYEMNVLLELARKKDSIREVEISTLYFNNNSGSHFHTVRDSCRIYKEILRFSASSLACFLLDYGVYGALTLLTQGAANGLMYANMGARLVSASANYAINRKYVFRSHGAFGRAAVQYFALALVILAGNTLVLSVLVQQAGINPFGAKIMTEALFFAVSWLAQRLLVFGKAGGARG